MITLSYVAIGRIILRDIHFVRTLDWYYTHERKHKLVEDHPFSGNSAECRDTVEQTFRVTFGVKLRWSRGLDVRSVATSPRIASQVCLIYQQEYKFRRKVDDALRGEHARIRRFTISYYPLFAAGLTTRLTLADYRPFVLSVTSHTLTTCTVKNIYMVILPLI